MNKKLPEFDFTPEPVPLRRSIWLIFFCAVIILFFQLGLNALHGKEGVMAESIRELTIGKDIFARENWSDAAEKMQLWFCRGRGIAADFFGNDEFSCRFFSALAALFCLGGTMLFAQEFFDRRTMFSSAWMLIGSYGFIYWGRHISAFMTLAAWVIWCVYFLYSAEMNFRRRWLICFMLLAGIVWWGMNFILFIPGMFCITFFRSKYLFAHWNIIPAAAAGAAVLALLAAWQIGFPGIGWIEYPERIWRQTAGTFLESWREMLSPYSGNRWYLALGNLPRLIFPWTLPAVVVIIVMFRRWRELPVDSRNLLTGAIIMLLFTGIFPGRRWQYQLPQLPFFLILTASWISGSSGIGNWNDRLNGIMRWSFAVLCSFCLCVIVTWPLWGMVFLESPPLLIMFGVPLLGAIGLAALIFDTGRSSAVENYSGMNGAWSGYILAGTCFMAAILTVAAPALTRYRSGRPFWKKCGTVARNLPPEEVLFYGSVPDSKARYYMDLNNDCTVVDKDNFHDALAGAKVPVLLLVAERKDIADIKELLQGTGWTMDVEEPLASETAGVEFSADSAAAGNDKHLLLELKR